MIKIKTVLNILAYCMSLLAFIPLFPHIEGIPKVAVPAALAVGILIDLRGWSLNRLLPTLLSLSFFTFYLTRFSAANIVGPAVNLLVILLAVRLLSEKIGRNYLQIYALSLFSLAGSSLFDLSALFLCYFLLMLTMIAVSLVLLTFYTSSASQEVAGRDLRKIISVALIIPIASVPLIVLFFFVLPRTQYPLLNFLNMRSATVTGFSEKVDPGSSNAIGDLRNVAFRVSSARLPQNYLYWRGIVLNSFEGKAWVRAEPPGGEQDFAGKGETIRQTVFPEPGRGGYLIALNIPQTITGTRFAASRDVTFEKRGSPTGHEKYETVSSLTDTIVSKNAMNTRFYLQLPFPLSSRMAAVATAIAGKGKDDADKVALLEEFYRRRGLRYSTSNLAVGSDPLDEFLFEKRSGHCEFFASSFAVLLRAAGVPSRLVGGYYGGDYNEVGGYYVISEGMAHVWVEAFIRGRGWMTIDPSQWSVNFAGAGARRERGVLGELSLAADTVTYYWNVAVINYDLDRQLRLISAAGTKLEDVSFHPFKRWPIFVLSLTAAFALFILRRRPRSSPEERILKKFLAEIQREYGLRKAPATSLNEFVKEVNDRFAERFVSTYETAVYHDRALTSEELAHLQGLLRAMRNCRKKSFYSHSPQ